MDAIAPLFWNAEVFFLVFGLVMAAGGLMGYVKARSVASLVAGATAGVLLIVGALLIPKLGTWQVGAVLELLVSLALLGRFLPALLRGKLNPASYVVPLSVVGVVLALALLLNHGHP